MEEQQSLEIANFRYRLIAPIVSRVDLPPGQIQALIGEAARKSYQIPYSNRTTVSVRSIERYLQAYREEGFAGLKPKVREGRQRRIPEEYLKLAALMKKENPAGPASRSSDLGAIRQGSPGCPQKKHGL